MKRSLRQFIFEYFAAVFVQVTLVAIAAFIRPSAASFGDVVMPLVVVLLVFAFPVGFVRVLLFYCERAGVSENGFTEWLLRFVYWIPLAYIFHQVYLDYCFVNPGHGVLLGCYIALITGAGAAVAGWTEKKKRAPNQAAQTTPGLRPSVSDL